MEWWSIIPFAIGAVIGRLLWRRWKNHGWIVVVEFVGVIIASPNSLFEEGPYKFTLEPNGGLRGNKFHAKRFWTEKAAKDAAAVLKLGGIEDSTSFRVKDVYVMRYRDFSMEGE